MMNGISDAATRAVPSAEDPQREREYRGLSCRFGQELLESLQLSGELLESEAISKAETRKKSIHGRAAMPWIGGSRYLDSQHTNNYS